MPDLVMHFAAALAVALILEWVRSWASARRTAPGPAASPPRPSVISRPGDRKPVTAAGPSEAEGEAPSLPGMLLGVIWRSTTALFIGFLGSGFLAGMIETALDTKIPYGSGEMIGLVALVTAAAWTVIAGRSRRGA